MRVERERERRPGWRRDGGERRWQGKGEGRGASSPLSLDDRDAGLEFFLLFIYF